MGGGGVGGTDMNRRARALANNVSLLVRPHVLHGSTNLDGPYTTFLKEQVALDRTSWSLKSVCNRLL